MTFHALNGGLDVVHKVRVVDLDGAPWFVAADVCRVLGYAHINTSMTRIVGPLGPEEKRRAPKSPSLGKQPLIVSESGLYRLIMRSDKPIARQFQDWVTREVLPAIRKDGAYIAGEEKVRSGEMTEDELILKAVGILQKKVERLTAERDVLAAEVNRVTVDEYRALRQHAATLVTLATACGRTADSTRAVGTLSGGRAVLRPLSPWTPHQRP